MMSDHDTLRPSPADMPSRRADLSTALGATDLPPLAPEEETAIAAHVTSSPIGPEATLDLQPDLTKRIRQALNSSNPDRLGRKPTGRGSPFRRS